MIARQETPRKKSRNVKRKQRTHEAECELADPPLIPSPSPRRTGEKGARIEIVSEELLWQLLRNRQRCGKKFRRQHPLGVYTADFYCAEAQLVVEVDGSPHQTAEGKRKDQIRDAWMHSQGIEVLRFSGWQVEFETQQVLQCIDQALMQRCVK